MSKNDLEFTGKTCLKCGIHTVRIKYNKDQNNPRKGTEHHVLPKRYNWIHYYQSELNRLINEKADRMKIAVAKMNLDRAIKTIHLCYKCHIELEYLILKRERENERIRKLMPLQYEMIADDFCGGGVI